MERRKDASEVMHHFATFLNAGKTNLSIILQRMGPYQEIPQYFATERKMVCGS